MQTARETSTMMTPLLDPPSMDSADASADARTGHRSID
jgi:hypothetical protein